MKDDDLYLETIRECIDRIERFTAEGEGTFFNDEKTQDAVLRNFQVLGDAVKDLSTRFKETYPDIGWSEFAQFRDKVTHGYLGVDLDRVWDFKSTELQILKTKLDEIYKQQGKDQHW